MRKTYRNILAGASTIALAAGLLGTGVAWAENQGGTPATPPSDPSETGEDDNATILTEPGAPIEVGVFQNGSADGEAATDARQMVDAQSGSGNTSIYLSNVDMDTTSASGPCYLQTHITGFVSGWEEDWSWTDDGPYLELTATEAASDSGWNSRIDVYEDGTFDFVVFVRSIAVEGDHELEGSGGELLLSLELWDENGDLQDTWGDSFEYDLTSGCAKLEEVEWTPSVATIVRPAKSTPVELAGKLDLDGVPAADYEAHLYMVNLDAPYPFEYNASAEIGEDGTFAFKYDAPAAGAYKGILEIEYVPGFGNATQVFEFGWDAQDGDDFDGFVVNVAGPAPTPVRLSGANRYETNYQVNRQNMKDGMPLFVASGSKFPDALTIGPAVSNTDGSLILAPKTKVDPKMIELIKSRQPSEVFIIGGPEAVSNSVAKQIGTAAGKTPKRIGGKNRYETSAQVFTEFFGDSHAFLAFVATGADYPDALSAAAAGGSFGAPVLLVPGTKRDGKLEASSVTLLKKFGAEDLVVVGGPSVVTNQVVNNLKKQGPFKVTRQSGANRYATNMRVNDYVNDYLADSVDFSGVGGVWIATGTDFADALSGAGQAGKLGQRLVLSNGKCIPKPVVSAWINGPSSNVADIRLIGGTAVLKPSVAQLTECK